MGQVKIVVTEQQLGQIMPRLSKDKIREYLPFLNGAMAEFEVNTAPRVAIFLAQWAVESWELCAWIEQAHRKTPVKGCRLCTKLAASSLGPFPGHAAGAQYEGRADLGNKEPGDGEKFLGRGPPQLTGRANYRTVGTALGLDLEAHPELVATPAVGFRVAGQFWKSHGLNELADEGDFYHITERINGGQTDAERRQAYWIRAKAALGC